jgi:dihydroneopterin aldolase
MEAAVPFHDRPTDDRVIVRDLLVETVVGVYDRERVAPQQLRVDLALACDLRATARRDALGAGPDYDLLAGAVVARAQQAARRTLEALADDIARVCLGFAGVRRVRVRVRKPGAIAGAAWAAVQVTREPEDFE